MIREGRRSLIGLWVVGALFSVATAAHGQASFEACKAQMQTQVQAQYPDNPTLREMFADIEMLPRVIQADTQQPEFTRTFSDYYQKRVTPERISRGRQLASQHRELLQQITANTGVQGHFLLALWGLETNFGNYMGKLSIPSALMTLACDPRRAEFFRQQFMAVVQLVATGDMTPAQLVGSWAGAMGHMQFMPTTYLQYAVDADSDGRRDVYASLTDALTSAGNYLQALGWQPGYRWGREVLLPAGFEYDQAHADNWQPLTVWRDQGVTDTAGTPLPRSDLSSALVLPTGHTGPAFVVYPNFKRLMQWNRSVHYALTVGRLADRIVGLGELYTPLPEDDEIRLATSQMLLLQSRLQDLGFDPGEPDGVLGPATQRAIRAYQTSIGAVADGFPTTALLDKLNRSDI